MKNLTKYILYLLPFLLFSCRYEMESGKNGVIEEGLPARISVSFLSEENEIITRAAQDKETESTVHNLRVFIFNKDGEVICNKFFDDNNLVTGTSGTLVLNTTSAEGAKIFGIANLTTAQISTDYDIDENLDNITSFSQLESILARLEGETVNRTGSFLMSGYAWKNENGNERSTNKIDIPALSDDIHELTGVTLLLDRVDAKVTFNVTSEAPADKNWTEFSFKPSEWKVCRIPMQSLVAEKDKGDYDEAGSYFDSMELPFESVTRDDATALYSGGSFTFYLPENRKAPRDVISETGNAAADYSLREKRDQGADVTNPDRPGQEFESGNFTYANANSTYVEMTGTLSYKETDNNGKEYLVSSSVKYIVHLGYVNGVNDYDTRRNVHYTYNVKVRGVNDIIVEVTDDDELRSGYEGDVIYSSNATYFLDAHYDRALLHINKADIPNMSWGIDTPYGVGVYAGTGDITENLMDYRWIKFAVNRNYGTPANEYVKYPGDQNYKGGKNEVSGYGPHPKDKNARLLDVKQLLEYLKEQAADGNSTIFEEDGTVSVTAFIDEYVYVRDPRNPNAPENLLMWKEFTEAPERQMHLINKDKSLFSPDGKSSVMNSYYTFRQKSIRTIYDKKKSGLNTAWGLESEMEAVGDKSSPSGGIRLKPGNVSAGKSLSNGRQNSIDMLVGKSWTEVINVSEGGASLNSGYQTAAYACLTRNRDLNGDNIVQANEIRWYLASINQLTEMYIGENALDVDSRLFPESASARPGGNGLYWHYTSSSRESGGNPWIYWAEECGARSNLGTSNPDNKNGQYYSYRCLRNLGIDLDNPTEEPEQLIKCTPQADETYLVDATNLSPKARRGYSSTALPDHKDTDYNNLLYDKFVVNGVNSDYPEPWMDVNFWTGRWSWGNDLTWSRCIGEEVNLTDGYRLPNQRELLVMLNVLPSKAWKTYEGSNGVYDRSSKAMYMCKTGFSRTEQGHFGSLRQSFRMNAQGTSIGVLNSSNDDKGYIRGVKDYK